MRVTMPPASNDRSEAKLALARSVIRVPQLAMMSPGASSSRTCATGALVMCVMGAIGNWCGCQREKKRINKKKKKKKHTKEYIPHSKRSDRCLARDGGVGNADERDGAVGAADDGVAG
jgi:hypothetical protein